MSRLGLSTRDEKVDAVRRMAFPKTLRELETGLGFFGYYRKFVRNYVATARPLIRLKTEGFKGSPNKGRPRQNHAEGKKLSDPDKPPPPENGLKASPECYDAWEKLKSELCNAPTLAFPDFNRPFILYTDGSKEKRYNTALY